MPLLGLAPNYTAKDIIAIATPSGWKDGRNTNWQDNYDFWQAKQNIKLGNVQSVSFEAA